MSEHEASIVKGGRAYTRRDRVFCGHIHGEQGKFRCLVVNLSRTGAMFTLIEPEYLAMDNVEDLNYVGLRIASQFGESFELEFAGKGIRVDCELVRMAESISVDEFLLFMGCRFQRELTDEECEVLDLVSTPHDAVLFGTPTPKPEGAEPDAAEPAAVGAGGVRVADAPVTVRPSARVNVKPVKIARRGKMLFVDDLLRIAIKKRATDVHVKAGSPVRMRVDGTIVEMGDRPLTSDDATALARGVMSAQHFDRFHAEGDLDIAYSVKGGGRFRVNVLRTQGVTGMALRRIPDEIPSFETLGLSPLCLELADRPRGLVLVTGPTGSGKSTTLAAMIDHINTTRPCHIVTMEDPIEFLHTEKRAHVTQREIGRDTPHFAGALKRALRQDPDVILVGEMRDLETIALAVTAAETGHLVFATLHTTSAVLTVDRIVDVFPGPQQRQIRMQLADCLQGIMSQIMLPRRAGGLAVAQEILVVNEGVRALIRDGKTPQIGNQMQTGAKDGMQTLEQSLGDLVARDVVSMNAALRKANFPHLLDQEVRTRKANTQTAKS